eukprot:TRINITY_DN3324_c0_g1_i3.p1 TRINITY_DN3324_c0_g1~~TRINITY_DN3324_c0_g1_i3.p1  ORF type:complete len:475 (-),score=51.74 TRINITY_DN3324_c0_g1_i3:742-2166(-)
MTHKNSGMQAVMDSSITREVSPGSSDDGRPRDTEVGNREDGHLLFTVIDALLDEFRGGHNTFVYYIDAPLFRKAIAQFLADVLEEDVHSERIKVAGAKRHSPTQTVVAWRVDPFAPEQHARCVRALADPAVDLKRYFDINKLCRTTAQSWRGPRPPLGHEFPLSIPLPNDPPPVPESSAPEIDQEEREWEVHLALLQRGGSAITLKGGQRKAASKLREFHETQAATREPSNSSKDSRSSSPAISPQPSHRGDSGVLGNSTSSLGVDTLWTAFGLHLAAGMDPADRPLSPFNALPRGRLQPWNSPENGAPPIIQASPAAIVRRASPRPHPAHSPLHTPLKGRGRGELGPLTPPDSRNPSPSLSPMGQRQVWEQDGVGVPKIEVGHGLAEIGVYAPEVDGSSPSASPHQRPRNLQPQTGLSAPKLSLALPLPGWRRHSMDPRGQSSGSSGTDGLLSPVARRQPLSARVLHPLASPQ